MKMSRSLQILALFFLGIFVAPALELDEKECQQNYQQENHTYICAPSEQGKTLQAEAANDLTPAGFHTFFHTYFKITAVASNHLMQPDALYLSREKSFFIILFS